MSCRASADFLSAYLGTVLKEGADDIDDETLEVLAQTEHRRWNAFHFSMGYQRMGEEEWQKRAEEYKKQTESGEGPKIRISKNAKARRHASLVSWDELDKLSEKENAVTGGNVDYKQMDRENIRTIAKLLSE